MTQAPRYQRGAVALLALLLLSLLAGWQVAGLPRQTPVAAREATTRKALQQARQILIDWAVQRRGVSGNGVSNLARPGALPCPDLHIPGSAAAGYVGNDKTASCNSAGSRLGRVPWRSLQQQARPDSAGETLWLALAEPYQDGNNTPLNPATAGVWLDAYDLVAGVALASRDDPVVAVLLAPGHALAGQTRHAAAALLKPANYLEALAQSGRRYSNIELTAAPFTQGDVVDARGRVLLNDRIAVIRRSDLMPPLHARAVRHSMQLLSAWHSAFGRLPTPGDDACAGAPLASNLLVERLTGRVPASLLVDSAWLYRNRWHAHLYYATSATAGLATCARTLRLRIGSRQWDAAAILSTHPPLAADVRAGAYTFAAGADRVVYRWTTPEGSRDAPQWLLTR
ncbi:hypothetical protein JCM19000A_35640 [Silvimonas sp. JCM 19000]